MELWYLSDSTTSQRSCSQDLATQRQSPTSGFACFQVWSLWNNDNDNNNDSNDNDNDDEYDNVGIWMVTHFRARMFPGVIIVWPEILMILMSFKKAMILNALSEHHNHKYFIFSPISGPTHLMFIIIIPFFAVHLFLNPTFCHSQYDHCNQMSPQMEAFPELGSWETHKGWTIETRIALK